MGAQHAVVHVECLTVVGMSLRADSAAVQPRPAVKIVDLIPTRDCRRPRYIVGLIIHDPHHVGHSGRGAEQGTRDRPVAVGQIGRIVLREIGLSGGQRERVRGRSYRRRDARRRSGDGCHAGRDACHRSGDHRAGHQNHAAHHAAYPRRKQRVSAETSCRPQLGHSDVSAETCANDPPSSPPSE